MGKWFVKNGVYLTILSIIVALSSGAKEIVFAGYFGVSGVADAYTIAITVPETLFAVVWTAMNTVLIPTYQKQVYKFGEEKATRYISIFFTAIVIISCAFVAFSEIFADMWVYLFAPGFSQELHNLSVNISRWTFPMLIFEGIIRVCSGVLQAKKNFVLPKILVMIRNVGMILFLFAFSKEFGVLAAIFGLLTGVIIESILAFVVCRKYEKIKFIMNFQDQYLRKAGKQAIPVIVGTGVNEINQLVDKIVASFLVTGSMVALQYASKLERIITTVLLLNIVTLVFPTISEYVAKGANEEVKKIYEKTIKLLIIMSVPIVVGGFLLGEEIINIAFVRGAFDEKDALMVAPLFSVYLLASLFTTVRSVTVNLFAAYGKTLAIMYNTIIAVIINVVLNIVLSHLYGTVGLAIASCISAFIVSIHLIYIANKTLVAISFNRIGLVSIKTSISAFVMAGCIYVIKDRIDIIFETGSQIQSISGLIVLILLGVICYSIMHILLKTQEFETLFFIFRKSRKDKN